MRSHRARTAEQRSAASAPRNDEDLGPWEVDPMSHDADALAIEPSGLVGFARRLIPTAPYDVDSSFGFLRLRAVQGIEWIGDGWYRRTLRLAHGPALIELRIDDAA